MSDDKTDVVPGSKAEDHFDMPHKTKESTPKRAKMCAEASLYSASKQMPHRVLIPNAGHIDQEPAPSTKNLKDVYKGSLPYTSDIRPSEDKYLKAFFLKLGLPYYEGPITSTILDAMDALNYDDDGDENTTAPSLQGLEGSEYSAKIGFISTTYCAFRYLSFPLSKTCTEMDTSTLREHLVDLLCSITHILIPPQRIRFGRLCDGFELEDEAVIPLLAETKHLVISIKPSTHESLLECQHGIEHRDIIPRAMVIAEHFGGYTPGFTRMLRWALVYALSVLMSKLAADLEEPLAKLGLAGVVDDIVRDGQMVKNPFMEPIPYKLLEAAIVLRDLVLEVHPDKISGALDSSFQDPSSLPFSSG